MFTTLDFPCYRIEFPMIEETDFIEKLDDMALIDRKTLSLSFGTV